MHKDIVELESKVAFLEHQYDELNEVVVALREQIDRLEEELKKQQEQIEEANDPSIDASFRKPPHY